MCAVTSDKTANYQKTIVGLVALCTDRLLQQMPPSQLPSILWHKVLVKDKFKVKVKIFTDCASEIDVLIETHTKQAMHQNTILYTFALIMLQLKISKKRRKKIDKTVESEGEQ